MNDNSNSQNEDEICARARQITRSIIESLKSPLEEAITLHLHKGSQDGFEGQVCFNAGLAGRGHEPCGLSNIQIVRLELKVSIFFLTNRV